MKSKKFSAPCHAYQRKTRSVLARGRGGEEDSATYGIKTYGVGVSVRYTHHRIGGIIVGWPIESRFEGGQGQREDVVVHESGKDRKDTHHKHHIASPKKHFEDLWIQIIIIRSIFPLIGYLSIIGCQLLFIEDQVEGSKQHQGTVANITKHDSK